MARLSDFLRRRSGSSVPKIALEEIKKTWSVEEADVTPHEQGFDWLPGNRVVRVRIHEDQRKQTAAKRFRITIQTVLHGSAPVHDPIFALHVGQLARTSCPTYAPVYPPSAIVEKYFDGRPADVELFSSAYVYDETVEWMSGFLARMSLMQPINAELFSREAERSNGNAPEAVAQEKPTIGFLLDVYKHVIVPEGAEASRWIGSDEFEAFITQYGQSDVCFGFGDELGLSFETPFGSDSAIVRFRTDQKDAELGSGLIVETKIRIPPELSQSEPAGIAEATKWAAELNYLESVIWTDFPQLGRWHPLAVSEKESCLAHTSFVPNMYFQDGLIINFALWAIARVRWAREKLLPGMNDLTMLQILEDRLGSQPD